MQTDSPINQYIQPNVQAPPKDEKISIHICAADKYNAVKAWWASCLLGIISIFVIYGMGEVKVWAWGSRIVFIISFAAFALFLYRANNEKKYLQAKYGFK